MKIYKTPPTLNEFLLVPVPGVMVSSKLNASSIIICGTLGLLGFSVFFFLNFKQELINAPIIIISTIDIYFKFILTDIKENLLILLL